MCEFLGEMKEMIILDNDMIISLCMKDDDVNLVNVIVDSIIELMK